MLSSKASRSPFDNHLLAALPREEYARLSPYLEPVRLPAGRVLCEAGGGIRHAYFLKGGMASLLSLTEDGHSVEVGMIGNEGVVGLPAILGIITGALTPPVHEQLVQTGIIDRLNQALQDPTSNLRRKAAQALGTMMRSGVYLFSKEGKIRPRRAADLSAIH